MELCNLLGGLLYYNNGNISFDVLDRIKEYMSKKDDRSIDISATSIYLTVYSWKNYFEINGKNIQLTNYYQKHTDNVRKHFFDGLDCETKSLFWDIVENL